MEHADNGIGSAGAGTWVSTCSVLTAGYAEHLVSPINQVLGDGGAAQDGVFTGERSTRVVRLRSRVD